MAMDLLIELSAVSFPATFRTPAEIDKIKRHRARDRTHPHLCAVAFRHGRCCPSAGDH